MPALRAAQATTAPLPEATEAGALGVYQLKRYWARAMAQRRGQPVPAEMHDRHLDYLVIHACGLGLEQTLDYLGRERPSFDEFERWIVATTGGIEPLRVARINAAVTDAPYPQEIALWLAWPRRPGAGNTAP
jgi:hypothetical protein